MNLHGALTMARRFLALAEAMSVQDATATMTLGQFGTATIISEDEKAPAPQNLGAGAAAADA